MRQHLDSRRVTVRDLVEADLLDTGDRLRFSRPRSGEEPVATVSATGSIVFADGTEYDTPSDAARAAASIQVNGWIVWRTDANRTLASLRTELSDVAAGFTASSEMHQFLSEVGEQIRTDDDVQITVRELLRHWNARTRGTKITRRIEKDLTSHGLTTFPHFRDVTLDTLVRFSTLDDGSVRNSSPEHVHKLETVPVPDSDDDDAPQIGLKVGNLPSALGGVSFVLQKARSSRRSRTCRSTTSPS